MSNLENLMNVIVSMRENSQDKEKNYLWKKLEIINRKVKLGFKVEIKLVNKSLEQRTDLRFFTKVRYMHCNI